MYPVTEKVQHKQIARDERTIERAKEVMSRLNIAAGDPRALTLALEKIEKEAPDNLGRMIYPVSDKARCKQIKRDRRVIERAIDVVERMRVSPNDRLTLYFVETAINECKRGLEKQAAFMAGVEAKRQ